MEFNQSEHGIETINGTQYKYDQSSLDWLKQYGDEIPFWLGDIVQRVSGFDTPTLEPTTQLPTPTELLRILHVDYKFFAPNEKRPNPNSRVYHVGPDFHRRFYTSAAIEDLLLIERGPIWKFYHGEQLQFFDLRDEAEFHRIIGKYRSYSNPKGSYDWSREQIIEAIKSGNMHGINGTNDRLWFSRADELPIGHRYRFPEAIRFDNEDLGNKVAEVTLLGYGFGNQQLNSNQPSLPSI